MTLLMLSDLRVARKYVKNKCFFQRIERQLLENVFKISYK